MNRSQLTRKLAKGAALLAATLACVAFAQDPVKVSPDHYRVESENELVRVLRSSGPGRAKSPMHEHPENVVVYLKDADVRVVGPDGTAKDSHRKRGEAIWNDVQKHERINLSDNPYELIQIELKGPRSGIRPTSASLDPLKVNPVQFTVLVENEKVRVIRSIGGPHAKAALHAHPPYVSIALTDSHLRTTDETGATREAKRKAGSVTYKPALKHAEENLSDSSFESILVELK